MPSARRSPPLAAHPCGRAIGRAGSHRLVRSVAADPGDGLRIGGGGYCHCRVCQAKGGPSGFGGNPRQTRTRPKTAVAVAVVTFTADEALAKGASAAMAPRPRRRRTVPLPRPRPHGRRGLGQGSIASRERRSPFDSPRAAPFRRTVRRISMALCGAKLARAALGLAVRWRVAKGGTVRCARVSCRGRAFFRACRGRAF